jgi:hypothetical protein
MDFRVLEDSSSSTASPKRNFPFTCKEQEFKYNHRHDNNVFELLINLATKPVADLL